jgi:hypothetical protein
MGTMPGISMHTELEMLVRLGLSPREALAAATNNYAEQFTGPNWARSPQAAAPTSSSSTATPRSTSGTPAASNRSGSLLLDGNQIDRESLLKK